MREKREKMSRKAKDPREAVKEYFQTAQPSECASMIEIANVICVTRAHSEKWMPQNIRVGDQPKRARPKKEAEPAKDPT